MKYAIVEFIQSQTVEVVAVNWLTPEEYQCHWPPGKSNLSVLLKALAKPTEKWTSYTVRVLGKAGTR